MERAGGLDVPEQFAVHGRGQVVVDDGDGAGGYLARAGLAGGSDDLDAGLLFLLLRRLRVPV